MIIENGVLYDVDEGDIKNGTFEIPSSVTSIGHFAFYGCSSLENIKIPSSVTSIGYYAFWACLDLKAIEIPSSVTIIGDGAFYGCLHLQSVTISSSVTSIGTATFNNCSSLQSIIIPSSVTSIGDYAFCNCLNLQSITIPSSVTSIEKAAFCNCSELIKQGKIKATDENMKCRGFQYYLNTWYEESEAALCEKGFHYCENAFDLFNYYFGEIGKDVRFFEVETEGDSDERKDDSKRVCKRIKLVREIKSYAELLN